MGEVNNRKLASFCMPENEFDDYFYDRGITTPKEKSAHFESFQDEIKRELSSLPEQSTLLITSEHFHSRLNTQTSINKLNRTVSAYFQDVTILCYLREQTSLARSLYSTIIRGGGKLDIDSFMRRVNTEDPYYNYSLLLNRWREAFPNASFCVKTFEKQSFHEGDIRKDVMNLLLDGGPSENADFSVDRKNEGLGFTGLELCRVVNRAFPRYLPNGQLNPLRSKIVGAIESSPIAKSGEEPPSTVEIYDNFETSNREVGKDYLGIQDGMNPFRRPEESTSNTGKEIATQATRELLTQILNIVGHATALTHSDADIARDAAISIEQGNTLGLSDALALMQIAEKVRPEGELIKEKIEKYRSILAKDDFLDS